MSCRNVYSFRPGADLSEGEAYLRSRVIDSVGHSMAASIASGMGFLIGTYGMNVFAEAASDEPAFIDLDLISGALSGSAVTPSLAYALSLYRYALPAQCAKQGADLSKVKGLNVRFGTDVVYGPNFTVTSMGMDGRTSSAVFDGVTGRKLFHSQ